MGSTGYPGWGREFKSMNTEGKKKFIYEHEIGHSHRVVKDTIVGQVYYAVLSNSMATGQNFAVVAPFWIRDDEVIIKTMDESMGPSYYDMPASYLKLLPPTSSEYANNWREKVLANAKAKAQAKPAGVTYMYTFDKDGKYPAIKTLAKCKEYAKAYADEKGKTVRVVRLQMKGQTPIKADKAWDIKPSRKGTSPIDELDKAFGQSKKMIP